MGFFKENLRNESSHGKNFIEFRLNAQKTASSFSPQHTLRQMLDELRGQHAGYVSIVQGLLFRFFYYLTEEHNYVTTFFHLDFSQSDYIFDQICSYISQTNGQILRKDLELVLHYNADYLNKIVKKHSGMTLTEYIQSYRIKQAAKLICTTSDPIAKISHSLGFENKAYFYRLFEKYFHMSPLSYRKSRTTQTEE